MQERNHSKVTCTWYETHSLPEPLMPQMLAMLTIDGFDGLVATIALHRSTTAAR